MLKVFLGASVALLLTVGSAAQSPSEVPKQFMDQLKSLMGAYETVVHYSPDGGETWQTGAPNVVDIALRQKGLLLAEVPRDTSTPGFHLENYLTYDQYRQVYRKAVIDDTWGVMDIYEGTIAGDTLILTNLKADTSFPTPTGQMHFRLSIPLTAGERWQTIEASTDRGETWIPNFKVQYIPLEADTP